MIGRQQEQPASVAAFLAKRCAQGLGATLLALSGVLPLSAHAADTCFRDDTGRVTTRRLPGSVEVPCPSNKLTAPETPRDMTNGAAPDATPAPGATAEPLGFDRGPPPAASPVPLPGLTDYVESVPLPDRWRIVDALGYKSNLLDPYNRNPLKADKPFHDDWFFDVSLLSDTKYVYRDLVSAVDLASAERPGSNDVFGRTGGFELSQTVVADFVLYKGDTVFRPPDWQIRVTPAFNYNYAKVQETGLLNIDPREGTTRSDNFLGLQNAFVEKRLRDVSEQFDFDSIRVGIQPFSSDFRGFLFQDNQLGVRLFGTRDNNVFQYNLAYFRRIEKDTNSGLNDLSQPLRHDDVVVANLYWQDMPVKGFTSQGIVAYNHNTEGDEEYFDKNGFLERPAALGLERPRDYDVVYLGYNGDGHFGRTNATASFYYVTGHEQPGVFVNSRVDISAAFAAMEVSRDFDWARVRLSFLYATGDNNPYDHRATGFDAIFENPQFAGGDTSYWISQAVPLIGGGGVSLSTGNGVLADLRSSKDEGQSNFDNPGLILGGIGADFDVLPTLRVALNLNSLYFADTAIIAALRNQAFDQKHIGEDASIAVTWRPLQSQNIVLRAAYARLITSNGFDALFPNMNPNYFLLNAVLAY